MHTVHRSTDEVRVCKRPSKHHFKQVSRILEPPPTKKLLLEVEIENHDPGENGAKSDQHHNYPSKVQARSPLSEVEICRQVNLPCSFNATGNANNNNQF